MMSRISRSLRATASPFSVRASRTALPSGIWRIRPASSRDRNFIGRVELRVISL